ncbi:MAG: hypothetical protein FWD57_16310, partial [Polyangiaceae bacterium]|nr:hypothetical protein [Polyangiaceae bacterium]
WERSHANRACTEDWQCVQASNDLGFEHPGTRCDTFIHWTPQEIRREIAAEKAGGAGDDRLQLVKDTLEKSGKCTIPYRDRQVKTQGWFVNKEMPDLYQDQVGADGQVTEPGPTEEIVTSWNQMFTAAVGMARSAECRRTGGTGCHNQFFDGKEMLRYGYWLIDQPRDKTPVFVTCHNPVRDYDNEVCGERGSYSRTGDFRKLWLQYWPTAVNWPFLGVAHLHGDPTTGEGIGNTATVVLAPWTANQMLLPLLVAMGDMSPEEYLGTGGNESFLNANTVSHTMGLTQQEIDKRIQAFDVSHFARSVNPSTAMALASSPNPLKSALIDKMNTRYEEGLLGVQALKNHGALAPLRNTAIESALLDRNTLKVARLDPDELDLRKGVPSSILDIASPLRAMEPVKIEYIQRDISRRFARAGACFTDFEGGSPVGFVHNAPLAEYFRQKYGSFSKEERIAKMQRELEIEQYKQVMVHEMGHALGMRHQFASSWDSMNYMPQYWQLRTNDGQATDSCLGRPRDITKPDNCMGPRYIDPHTDDELGILKDENGFIAEPRPHIEYFGNTSVMEYHAEYFSGSVGLGTWDYHMTKAVYGKVVETYDTKVIPRRTDIRYGDPYDQRRLAPRMMSHLMSGEMTYDMQSFDDPDIDRKYDGFFGNSPMTFYNHYTKVARNMTIFDRNRDCRTAEQWEKDLAKWRIVHGDVCAPYPRDYAAWDDFESEIGDDYPEGELDPMTMWRTRYAPAQGANPEENYDAVRWSYKIGEMYWPSYVHANTRDSGADEYEATIGEIERYNAYYPVRYFRRNRLDAIPSALAWRRTSSLFDRLRSFHWSFGHDLLRWMSLGYYDQFSVDDNLSRGALIANAAVFNAMADWILAPQPGYNSLMGDEFGGVYTALGDVNPGDAAFKINIIDGRYVDDAYDYSKGDWEFELYETRSGFGWE